MKTRKRTPTFQGKPSRWCPFRDGVSSSLLYLWLTCREQFRLEICEGWRSRSEPFYFAYGTTGHWLLEQAYALKAPPTGKWVKARIKKYDAIWKGEVDRPTLRQLEDQERIYGLLEASMPFYFARWAGDWPGHEYPRPTGVASPQKWKGLETRFNLPHALPDGRVIQIKGTRDGLFWGKPRGRKRGKPKPKLWTFDSKFRSVIVEGDLMDTLPFDFQQMLYLWATWKLEGVVPAGCVMNTVRRPGQRLLKGEALSIFFDRVKKDVSNVKRWDHYFSRYQMEVTKAELEAWEATQLSPVIADLLLWWKGESEHYLNPNALVSKYGRCAMFKPIVFGDFGDCYQRTDIMGYQSYKGRPK